MEGAAAVAEGAAVLLRRVPQLLRIVVRIWRRVPLLAHTRAKCVRLLNRGSAA